MKTRFLLAALLLLVLALVMLPEQTAPVLAIPSCSQACGPNCAGATDCWCEPTQQRVHGCAQCPCAVEP
jgi:hypothetical protein